MNWSELRRDLLGGYNATGLPRWLAIPAFPTAVSEFCAKSADPAATPNDLGRIIEVDNGLTCELLRQVNSSSIALRHKASTAQRAISILGFHRSKMILLGAAAQLLLKNTALKGFDHERFTVTNLQRGFFARIIAGKLGADEDLAFAGGMMCDCILPSLASNRPEVYAAYAQAQSVQGQTLTQHEKTAFGFGHDYAAAQICLGYKFPDDLLCCILLHHTPLLELIRLGLNGSAVVAVRLAALLPDPFRQEPDGLQILTHIAAKFPGICLSTIAAEVDALTREMCPQADPSTKLSQLLAPSSPAAAPELSPAVAEPAVAVATEAS